MPSYVKLSPDQAKITLRVVKDQRSNTALELKKMQQFLKAGKGTPGVLRAAQRSIEQLQVQERKLNARLSFLKKGFDIVEPPKVDPSRVPHLRTKLVLPRAYIPPSASAVKDAATIIAKIVPQLRNESSRAYRLRKQTLLQRSLARAVIKRVEEPQKPAPELMQEAIKDAIVKDDPIIQEEIAAGGVVPDAAAEAMDPVVESADPPEAEGSSGAGTVLIGLGILALGAFAARKKGYI